MSESKNLVVAEASESVHAELARLSVSNTTVRIYVCSADVSICCIGKLTLTEDGRYRVFTGTPSGYAYFSALSVKRISEESDGRIVVWL